MTLVAALLLSACTSDAPGSGLDVQGLRAQLAKRLAKNRGVAAANPLVALTRAKLAGREGPVMIMYTPKKRTYSTLGLIGENQDVQTFGTPTKKSISMSGGVMLATRGLGADLLAADTQAVRAALKAAKATTYTRRYRRLDGTNLLVKESFQCSLTNAGAETIEIVELRHRVFQLRERCENETSAFSNTYWASVDNSVIYKSHQWVSRKVGYLDFYLLID